MSTARRAMRRRFACAAAAIETVITTHTGTALMDEDRAVIKAIAAAAQQADAGRPVVARGKVCL